MKLTRHVAAVVALVAVAGVGAGVVAARWAPVPDPPAQVIWPFIDFQTVPRLGTENVRGSGCGGAAELGNRIPDGVWAGQIDNFVVPNGEATSDSGAAVSMAFDVWCVYQGNAAINAKATPGQKILVDNPEYLVINNNERTRGVPLADGFILRYAVRLVDGRCIDPGPAGFDEVDANGNPLFRSKQAWVNIRDGRAVWALIDCAQ